MPETLLIVGGTGFIGRRLSECALENGMDVIVLSLTSPILKNKIESVTYVQSDITDLSKLRDNLSDKSIDCVVNLSGYVDHSDFLRGGVGVMKTHFIGVQNLLQVLDWTKLRRFVQIGSSDEYGDQSAPQREIIRERPISPYSVGKAATTHLLETLFRTEALPCVVLRLFLVYGPKQNNQRFLPQIINGCISNNYFPVSLGEQLRDFCFIDDVIKAIFLAIGEDKANGEVFNIASGQAISIREVIEHVKAIVGRGKPEFGKVPYRSGENMKLYADISKARQILGWRPEIDFEDGLAMTIDHYLKEVV
jgi:nucleoside-diphosphate-sugar epimerase